jgi:hypothetical protein
METKWKQSKMGTRDLISKSLPMRRYTSSAYTRSAYTRSANQRDLRVKMLGPTVGKVRSPFTFIRNLWAMLQDRSLSHVIGWERDGRSFVVKDRKEMEKAVLPQFFKSHLFKSFKRQLDYYGFSCLSRSSSHHNCLKTKSSMICALPLFCRDDPQSVLLIKRKVNTGNKPARGPRKRKRPAMLREGRR